MPEMLLVYTVDKQAHALSCQPQTRTSALGYFYRVSAILS